MLPALFLCYINNLPLSYLGYDMVTSGVFEGEGLCVFSVVSCPSSYEYASGYS